MSIRPGELPRRPQLELMAYLCAVGESTIREFLTAKGLSEAKLPIGTIAGDLRALEQRGWVEATVAGQGKPTRYKATISQAEFQDWVAKYLLEAAFDGDAKAWAAAVKRIKAGSK